MPTPWINLDQISSTLPSKIGKELIPPARPSIVHNAAIIPLKNTALGPGTLGLISFTHIVPNTGIACELVGMDEIVATIA